MLLDPDHKLGGNSQQTAKRAAEIVIKTKPGFLIPDKIQRRTLRIAFAARDHALYGKAFDIVRIEGELFDLSDPDEVEKNWSRIKIYEIKSTGKKTVKEDFKGYFFSISTAELLTAQDLKEKYGFLFVNTNTGKIEEMGLREIFAKAKGIYPTWSIQF